MKRFRELREFFRLNWELAYLMLAVLMALLGPVVFKEEQETYRWNDRGLYDGVIFDLTRQRFE
jgi:hypothetical protein